MGQEPMNVDMVVKLLNEALPLQMRSPLQYVLMAGSFEGVEFQAIGQKMETFGEDELADTRRLIEKITALGGRPTTEMAPLRPPESTGEAIEQLIADETETLEALRRVIPETGQEARSEALEHLLEHLIMRKQNQIDFLIRARGARPR